MNYVEMSDFEINKAVGMTTGEATVSEPVFNQVIRNSNGREFNPCNSWADAGPIIETNHIDLIWYELDACWGAQKGMLCAYDNHPLRAAMIVFLMMRDSKK